MPLPSFRLIEFILIFLFNHLKIGLFIIAASVNLAPYGAGKTEAAIMALGNAIADLRRADVE